MDLLSEKALNDLLKVLSKAKNEHPLTKVVRVEGMRLKRDADRTVIANCPSLAHSLRSPSLKVDLSDPNHFQCTACGAWGDVFDFIGLAHGYAYLAKQYELLTGQRLESQVDPQYAVEIKRVAERQRREVIEGAVAPDEVCNFTYRALLERLTLHESHYKYLTEQGATEEDCDGRGYKSLPANTKVRVDICENLIASGCLLESVPGFFRLPKDFNDERLRGRLCVGPDQQRSDRTGLADVAGYEGCGILIPVRDIQRRIVRLILKSDTRPLGISEGIKENRLSQAAAISLGQGLVSKSGGAAGITRLHHAYPVGGDRRHREILWVVEGVLSADIISGRLNAHVLGVPGFGRLTDELLDAISHYREVRIALNDYANSYTEELHYQIGAAGSESYIVRWNHEVDSIVEDCLMEGDTAWWLEPDPFFI